jgi:putative exporter of polyketide antibiotics
MNTSKLRHIVLSALPILPFMHVLDILSTHTGLMHGMTEGNPIAAWMFTEYGLISTYLFGLCLITVWAYWMYIYLHAHEKSRGFYWFMIVIISIYSIVPISNCIGSILLIKSL